jgi:3-hydroxy-9,10-secoandrosta-1,3,5(10)-triene-9,17-dione monooxygenase reductase component
MGHYPTGVSVVAAREVGGRPVGMAVGSFQSVSLDPPLVCFMPGKSSTSWPLIERTGRFCVNVLSVDQNDLCRRFSIPGQNKFEGLDYASTALGSPLLAGVAAWVDCTILDVLEAGDHFIVLGRVHGLGAGTERPLLVLRGAFGSFEALGSCR